MLCITAAHTIMQCPSVCLSVTFVCSVEMCKLIFKLFSLLGRHTILVFPHQMLWQYLDGDPLTAAKIMTFDEYPALAMVNS